MIGTDSQCYALTIGPDVWACRGACDILTLWVAVTRSLPRFSPTQSVRMSGPLAAAAGGNLTYPGFRLARTQMKGTKRQLKLRVCGGAGPAAGSPGGGGSAGGFGRLGGGGSAAGFGGARRGSAGLGGARRGSAARDWPATGVGPTGGWAAWKVWGDTRPTGRSLERQLTSVWPTRRPYHAGYLGMWDS
jgi:hypothetical protein